MTSNDGSRKALPLVVVGVLALAVGYFIGKSTTTVPPAPAPVPTVTNSPVPAASPTPVIACGNQIVVVGPDPSTLSADPICIAPSNQVTWRSDQGQPLVILFPESGFPPGTTVPPFTDMQLIVSGTKRDWQFKHHFGSSVEVSTPVNPALINNQPHGQYEFKYDQLLAGRRGDG